MGVTKIMNLVSPEARVFSKKKQGSAEKVEKRNQVRIQIKQNPQFERELGSNTRGKEGIGTEMRRTSNNWSDTGSGFLKSLRSWSRGAYELELEGEGGDGGRT